ncbi:hypothetical protein HDV00_005717 [Rhizophlyctis rosea]|nr:hypothetical protein HDV00_005717 [Rhizophlyctis rosea]
MNSPPFPTFAATFAPSFLAGVAGPHEDEPRQHVSKPDVTVAGLVVDAVEPVLAAQHHGPVREKAVAIVADEFLVKAAAPIVADPAKRRAKKRRSEYVPAGWDPSTGNGRPSNNRKTPPSEPPRPDIVARRKGSDALRRGASSRRRANTDVTPPPPEPLTTDHPSRISLTSIQANTSFASFPDTPTPQPKQISSLDRHRMRLRAESNPLARRDVNLLSDDGAEEEISSTVSTAGGTLRSGRGERKSSGGGRPKLLRSASASSLRMGKGEMVLEEGGLAEWIGGGGGGGFGERVEEGDEEGEVEREDFVPLKPLGPSIFLGDGGWGVGREEEGDVSNRDTIFDHGNRDTIIDSSNRDTVIDVSSQISRIGAPALGVGGAHSGEVDLDDGTSDPDNSNRDTLIDLDAGGIWNIAEREGWANGAVGRSLSRVRNNSESSTHSPDETTTLPDFRSILPPPPTSHPPATLSSSPPVPAQAIKFSRSATAVPKFVVVESMSPGAGAGGVLREREREGRSSRESSRERGGGGIRRVPTANGGGGGKGLSELLQSVLDECESYIGTLEGMDEEGR